MIQLIGVRRILVVFETVLRLFPHPGIVVKMEDKIRVFDVGPVPVFETVLRLLLDNAQVSMFDVI